MRLTQEQSKAIFSGLRESLNGNFEVYLVGSRVHDHLKGGDLDLLILMDKADIAGASRVKAKIKNKIMKDAAIDDMRVDLIFATREALESDSFVSTLKDSMIRLS